MTSREPPAEWTRLPTVADVRKRIRDRRDDVSAVADDVIAAWRACGCGVRNGRERAEARVASLEEGDGAELLDLAQDLEDEPHFNAVFHADQRLDRCIEVVDGGRAFLVGGRFRVENDDPGGTWSLRAQLRLAMAHIEFLREVKTGLEVGRARLEEALVELRTRRDRALRRVAEIILVIEEVAVRTEEEKDEAEIDLGKMLGSVDAALREKVEEIEGKITDTLPAVTKMTCKSKKVSNMRKTTQRGEGSFLCPYCGKRFTLANSFSAHLSDHGGRRRRNRLICQTCGRGFSDAVALASHRSAAHHAEKGGVNNLD